MFPNTSEMILRTMLFLVNNEHMINENRIETNTLYHIKTGESHASTKCFGDNNEFGCYSLGEPWTSEARPISLYPEPPEVINVTYCLYTRRDRANCQRLKLDEPHKIGRTALIPSTRTYFLIHGFIESGDKPWIQTMKDRLLNRSEANVIVVDWGQGSGPPYNQAVANIRMVGFITAILIKRIQNATGMNPLGVHIVGHSLGSHVAGYVGYHLRTNYNLKLGRITGMDPAQPHFSNTDPLVRLDPTDAEFVDVIHTDAIDMVAGGFGMEEPVGHLDFYPNGGNTQPGCEQNIFSFISQEDGSLFKGIKKFIGCNHVRAHEFFSESIVQDTRCKFLGVECESYQKFLNGSCFNWQPHMPGDKPRDGQLRAYMGLDAGLRKSLNPQARPARLFLLTGPATPYCRWHYLVTVRLSASRKSESDGGEVGRLKITLRGSYGTAKDMQLYERETFLARGTVHQRMVSGARVGSVHNVTLTFEYITSVNPLTWRFFEATKIHVASITVQSLGDSLVGNDRITLCTKDDTLISGKPVTLTRPQHQCHV